MKRSLLALAFACATGSIAMASFEPFVPIQQRAKGADAVVVATIVEVTPTYDTNEFGDHIIISHTFLRVDEVLKGTPSQVIPLDVEGGTVDGITLKVSDMESVATGDRGVFFVARSRKGTPVPYLRHNGILKLDTTGHVRGSTLTLDDVRRQVRQGLQ